MISFDFETKSYADLKKVGAWAYSEDPTTDAICYAYGTDDRTIRGCIDMSMPSDLKSDVKNGYLVEAHNVAFERSIWANVMVPKYGWVMPDDEQWRDSMATAAYYALPMALDRLSRVLGFEGKNPAGTRLISKYSKLHLKTAKTEIPEDDLKLFVEY